MTNNVRQCPLYRFGNYRPLSPASTFLLNENNLHKMRFFFLIGKRQFFGFAYTWNKFLGKKGFRNPEEPLCPTLPLAVGLNVFSEKQSIPNLIKTLYRLDGSMKLSTIISDSIRDVIPSTFTISITKTKRLKFLNTDLNRTCENMVSMKITQNTVNTCINSGKYQQSTTQ